jgi:carboxylesterase type B
MAGGGYDQPPFRAAIAEYPWWQPFFNDSSQEIQLFNVLNLAGCTNVNCLRALPASQLQSIHQQSYITGYGEAGAAYGVFYYGPVVDGRFLLELPHDAFKAGRFYDVPLIVDRDGYEGVDFTNTSLTTQAEETADAEILFPAAGPAFFSRLYQLYPASNFNSTFYQRAQWFGDMIIECTALALPS